MMSDILHLKSDPSATTLDSRQSLGSEGEALAAEFLTRNGCRIVMSNFKVPVGRNSKGVQFTGEIDIVALDGDTLCFVEVKTRRSDEFTPLTSNVDLRKQRQIIRTAKLYRRIFNIYEMPHRYDVVTVLMAKGSKPAIGYFKGFWSETKFRKKNWGPANWREFY